MKHSWCCRKQLGRWSAGAQELGYDDEFAKGIFKCLGFTRWCQPLPDASQPWKKYTSAGGLSCFISYCTVWQHQRRRQPGLYIAFTVINQVLLEYVNVSCHVYEHVQVPGETNTLQRYSKIVYIPLLCLNTFQKYNLKIYSFLNDIKKIIIIIIIIIFYFNLYGSF